jgi:hypothetical protein
MAAADLCWFLFFRVCGGEGVQAAVPAAVGEPGEGRAGGGGGGCSS